MMVVFDEAKLREKFPDLEKDDDLSFLIGGQVTHSGPDLYRTISRPQFSGSFDHLAEQYGAERCALAARIIQELPQFKVGAF